MPRFFDSLFRLSHLGEGLSVLAALAWAMAVILFLVSGRKVHPLALNLFKSLGSSVLLLFTLAAAGSPLLVSAPFKTYALLAASGIFGIALADTYFLKCLNLMGAGLTAVIDCLYSPFVIILSILILRERMKAPQVAGVALILLAILIVSVKKNETKLPANILAQGVSLGALAMLLQAAGIVMIKPILSDVSILWATWLRVTAAALTLMVSVAFHPERQSMKRSLLIFNNWKAMVPAALLGSYIGLLAWMLGMKLTRAVVAAPLNQLNTIFIFILAALFLKEKATPVKIAAVVLAFAGACLASF